MPFPISTEYTGSLLDRLDIGPVASQGRHGYPMYGAFKVKLHSLSAEHALQRMHVSDELFMRVEPENLAIAMAGSLVKVECYLSGSLSRGFNAHVTDVNILLRNQQM